MKTLSSRLLLLIATILFFASVSFASSVDDVAKTLEISGKFPTGSNAITIGEQTSIVLNVKNKGETKATIHNIVGSLYNQKDEKIIRNLTATRTRVPIPPNKSVNITYKFKVELEPREVGLIVNLDWYTEEDTGIRSVGYKGLINVKSGDSLFDLQSIFLYILILGALGGAGYYVYNTYIVVPTKKVKAKKAKAAPVVKDAAEIAKDDEDWIPDHVKRAQAAQEASRSPKIKKRK